MAKEKRLIDPAEYKSFLKRYIKELHEVDAPMIAGAVERCLQKLEMQPTVDAVEVVRCKHCRHTERRFGVRFCKVWQIFLSKGDEGFCHRGERKDK